jgi:hypothetical protein
MKFLVDNEGKIEVSKAAAIKKRAEKHYEKGGGMFGGGQATTEIFDDLDIEAEFRNMCNEPEYMQIFVHVTQARNRSAAEQHVAANL